MLKALKPGFLMMVVMTVLTGLIYPAAVTALAQLLFRDQANGSLITANGRVVGSRLIGQPFSKPEYFHPRPSAAGAGYDPIATAGSNLGPTSAKFVNGAVKKDEHGATVVDFPGIKLRVVQYCLENGLPYESNRPLSELRNADGTLDEVQVIQAFGDPHAPLVFTPKVRIPADAVTASASGLDPHISPANADLQAHRVAAARGVAIADVRRMVARFTSPRDLGFLGEPRVNVLELNLALDDLGSAR
jgi:K+-transporting ATPase ATPase C chain